MRLSKILLIVIRVLAWIQVVLGIAFWTGHWYGLVPLHRGGGMLFVLTLWAIATLALVRREKIGLAVATIAWGLLVAAIGFTQQSILPGDFHWIVRIGHLVIAMASMPLAGRLAMASTPLAGRVVQTA